MKFEILMGIPEMEDLWNDLTAKADSNTLSKNETMLFKKLVKCFALLSENPRHNSLASHEIAALSRRYGMKVWQSSLENNVPAAGRVFWVYAPRQHQITVLGIEPHPEDKKKGGYDRVSLSGIP
jgi:hypothetical protein